MIIKNFIPITREYSIKEPYFKVTIEKEYSKYVASFKSGYYIINTRQKTKEDAIKEIKRSILLTYMNLKDDKELRRLFGDNAKIILERIQEVK